MRLGTLIKKIEEYNPKADFEVIRRAYKFAEDCHKGQKRVSGEQFIQHPLQVAYILAEHRLDTTSIVAAFFHDIVEDTDVSLEEIRKEFGNDVANIVDGVTNISKFTVPDLEDYHAESLRKVIMASARDIRVIFLKLADKLHNMRTLECFRPEKQKRIALEVRDVYAPIAYKLGIASMKWELEDLAMKYLQPETYNLLREKIEKNSKERASEVERVKAIIEKELDRHGIVGIVTGRSKHLYSIYKKMQKKSCCFEEVYDLIALRVMTQSVKDCYEVIGIIHNLWKPIPKEFDDYIAMPKPNMYQSLHTAVIGPDSHPIEVQVRTEEMHHIAEDGIAAHWGYKGVQGDSKFDAQLSWMKQILEWQRDSKDSKEFVNMLKIDFFEDELFTFTPKGKVIELPLGSCVLDFAYAVHSSIGDRCIGGKVNNCFVPLRSLLKNGDVVEVVTSSSQKPSRDWLKFVRTEKAKQKIRQVIREHSKIPVGSIRVARTEKKEVGQWIIESGISGAHIKIAKCCSPLPGDSIVGYFSRRLVSVHRADCPSYSKFKQKARKLKEFEEVAVRWVDAPGSVIEFYVEALNRVGLFAEILNTLVAAKTSIKSAKAKLLASHLVECRFSVELKDLQHLQEIVGRVKNIKDVRNIYVAEIEKKEKKK